MPAPFGLSPEDLAKLQQITANNHLQQQTATTANPRTVLGISSLQRAHPGLSPGTTYSLAAGGVPANSPIATGAWQAELANKVGQSQPGQQHHAPARSSGGGLLGFLGRAASTVGRNIPGVQSTQDIASGNFGAAIKHTIPGEQLIESGAKAAIPPAIHAATSGISDLYNTAAENHGLLSNVPGLSGLTDSANAQTTSAVRSTAVAAQSGLEALQGGLRLGASSNQAFGGENPFQQIGTAVNQLTAQPAQIPGAISDIAQQTTGYQALQGKSTGSGLLPSSSSEAAQAQAEAARRFSPYLVGGHAWTPGRALAGTVLEPDSEAFNIASGIVDASVAISKLDPTAAGLSALSDYRAAQKTILSPNVEAAQQAAGAYQGVRKIFMPQKAEAQLASPQTQYLFQKMAEEPSAYILHNKTGLPYFNADGTPLLSSLARARTPEAVQGVFNPLVGNQITQMPSYGQPMGFDVPMMPKRATPLDDPNGAIQNLTRHMKNAKVPEPQIQATVDRLAQSIATPSANRSAAIFDGAMESMKQSLIANGVQADHASDVTTLFKNRWESDTNYMESLITHDMASPVLTVDGQPSQVLPHPFWDMEYLRNNILMPDPREIRRMVSDYSAIVDSQPYKVAVGVLDAGMNAWKTSIIARLALPVRTIGDAQLRMAATGLDSIFNPHTALGAISSVIGNPDSTISNLADKFGRFTAAGKAQQEIQRLRGLGEEIPQELYTTVKGFTPGKAIRGAKAALGKNEADVILGAPFSDMSSYNNSMLRSMSAAPNHEQILLNQFQLVPRDHPLYPQAVGEELSRLMQSPMARGMLQQDSPLVAQQWFWDGAGARIRMDLAQDPTRAAIATSRDAANAEIDKGFQLIRTVTDDHPDLLNAVRTGQMGGAPLLDPNNPAQISRPALAQIQALVDQGVGPAQARVRKFLTLSPDEQTKAMATFNHVVDTVMDYGLTKPNNAMAYSPAYRQVFTNEAERMLPDLSAEDRASLLKNIDLAKIGDAQATRLRAMDARMTQLNADLVASGKEPLAPRLTLDQASAVAGYHASTYVKDTLHTLSERSQVADVLRLVAPFGDAWRQMITKWAKVVYENPVALRRVQQVYQGATAGVPGGIASLGVPADQGFFHKDQYGQEVFSYPGSELLTKTLTGVPVPLSGSVKGLSLLGSGLPGVGPVVSIPASYFLPQKPGWDQVSARLFPFGDPNTGNPINDIPHAFLPSWLGKIQQAFTNPNTNRTFAGTVMDTARYLQSTGDYKLQGDNAQQEMNRLLTDAKSKAQELTVIRGLVQFGVPSAPSPEWQVYDKSGNLTAAWRLSKWYSDHLKSSNDPQGTLNAFLDKFGFNNFLIPQGQSKAVVPGAPTTKNTYAWAQAHPAVVADYPHTYGLIAPSSGKFDLTVFNQQFSKGERISLTPVQMLRAANNRIATTLYDQARAQTGTSVSAAEAAALRDYHASLVAEFPGMGDPAINSTTKDSLIAELIRAAADKSLQNNPTIRGLNAYMTLRDQTLALSQKAGVANPWSGTRTAPLRAALATAGEAIVEQYPSFRRMFDAVFSREVRP